MPNPRDNKALRLLARAPCAALSLAVLAGGLVGCEEDEVEVSEADPVVVPQTTGDTAGDGVQPPVAPPRAPERAAPDLAQRQPMRGDASRDQASAGRSSVAVSPARWQVDANAASPGQTLHVLRPDGSDGLLITRQQPREVRAGATMRYSISLENTSSDPMYNIVIKEWRQGGFQPESGDASLGAAQDAQRLPALLNELDSSDQSGADQQAGTQQQPADQGAAQRGARPSESQRASAPATWRVPRLAAGETRTIEVVGVAPQEGQITTCLTASFEPTVCTVTEVVKPQLVLDRRVEDTHAFVCDDLGIGYIIRNVGSAPAEGATLVESLPDGLMTADGKREIRIDVGTIPPGETVRHEVMVSADRSGAFASSATLTAGEMEARSTESTIRFAAPQLELTVDAPAREYVGRDIPLMLRIRNTGDAPSLDTVVRVDGLDTLPRASLSTQAASIDGDMIRIGTIPPNQSREMTVTFHATSPQRYDIPVVVNAYCAEEVQREVGLEVRGVEAVRLETIDLVDPVAVGDETVYEVKVKNQGTAESINVSVTATLPDEMSFVEASGDSRVSSDGQTLTFAPIEVLPPGEVASWRITTTAESAAKTQFKLELTSDATQRPVVEREPTTIIGQATEVGDAG